MLYLGKRFQVRMFPRIFNKGGVPVGAILMVTLLFLPSVTYAFDRYNQVLKYDKYFSKYSKRYFGPGFDWHYFKAQAIAESQLQADAASTAGAKGIMQIMPATFEEILQKNPSIKGTRKQPRWNIAAGIYYDRTIWNLWTAERPFKDRINFMFGSYNAGKGNILKAQKIANTQALNPNLWQSIAVALPKVTGKRSKETIGYVQKIERIKEVLR
jgi:membrane-bound lytic murein transglycosylase F